MHCFIFAIDVGVLYRNVDKLDEEKEIYKVLPNITKQWFRNNPKTGMPNKFKTQKKKPQSKKESSVSTSDTETDDSCSDDDNSVHSVD